MSTATSAIATAPSPMQIALEQARQAAALGEIPIGAVVVRQGTIIAQAHNRTRIDSDPTAHAEMLAIRAAAGVLGRSRLDGCDLYSTLEPCAMCAGAIASARIVRLYYGASDPKSGGVAHGARVFAHATCHHKPEVYDLIAAEAAEALLRDFFARLR